MQWLAYVCFFEETNKQQHQFTLMHKAHYTCSSMAIPYAIRLEFEANKIVPAVFYAFLWFIRKVDNKQYITIRHELSTFNAESLS